jgi:hypothetical protein
VDHGIDTRAGDGARTPFSDERAPQRDLIREPLVCVEKAPLRLGDA